MFLTLKQKNLIIWVCFTLIYYQWAHGLVEDRFLGMEKAAGSIPARSIPYSLFPLIRLKSSNNFLMTSIFT